MKNNFMKKITHATTACALLISISNVEAASLTISEWSEFSSPSFMANYSPNTVVLDLVSGISQTAVLGVLTYDTEGNSDPGSVTSLDSLMFNINGGGFIAPEFTLSSPITGINTNSDYFVSLDAGGSYTFDLGTVFTAEPSTLTVTLLASDTVFGNTSESRFFRTPLDITRSAEFLLTTTASPVPVPAAVWLFGSGLVGLAGIARRKKNP